MVINMFEKMLPPGHIGLKEAEKKDTETYGDCRRIENSYKFSSRILTLQQMAVLSDQILRVLNVGHRRLKLKINKGLVHLASCGWDTIELKYSTMPMYVLVHELAHFVVRKENLRSGRDLHHDDFLWVEKLLFEVVETL